MTAQREIGGIQFICEMMKGEDALGLFLRCASTLRPAQNLFIAIATGEDEVALIHAFFEFAREMDPAKVHPLTMDLARLARPADGSPFPEDLDLMSILECAFFGAAVNFGDTMPAGIDPLMLRSRALQQRAQAEPVVENNGGQS
ncbi:hypothetical protein [Methylobacterium sp. J-070]|uniref:hypothetical protein n=1 Tax=Methylobacterium sp. J-070 TaxID=2836650 RepID=UPI001FBAC197|nr:hypothetical protein [Methylobacterium sp. J-070]MCJ2048533.1 hypothetical protein [Methylobacterium sp. J-070]